MLMLTLGGCSLLQPEADGEPTTPSASTSGVPARPQPSSTAVTPDEPLSEATPPTSAPPTDEDKEPQPTPAESAPTPTIVAPNALPYLYFVAIGDNGTSGYPIGCDDSVVPVRVEQSDGTDSIESRLTQLFDYEGEYYGQSGLYNALNASDLAVVPGGVSVDEDYVTVHLTGALRSGGTCDAPRIHQQIAFTAATAAGVDHAIVYLNGNHLSDVLSERG